MNSTETNTWNELVACHNGAKIYHLHQWGTLMKEIHGHKPIYLREEEGVFPLVYIKSFIFGNRLISLPFADYGGPCTGNMKTADKLISECQEKALELDIDFIEIRNPGSQYFEILTKQGFIRRDDYITFVLRLDNEIENLWKGIGSTRNRIKKANNHGIQIIEAADKADLKAFYLIYQKTMKKLGSPPQPYKYFNKMWDLFYPQKMKIILARYEGKNIAGGLFFPWSNTIHYAYGCSLRDYLHLNPNDLIQWHIIEWGNKHGFRYLDFGRTRENEGTVQFKKKWGGEAIGMPYFYKFYKKGLSERQEVQYAWLSRIWARYLPENIANWIGPWAVKQVG